MNRLTTLTPWEPFKTFDPFRELEEVSTRLNRFFGAKTPTEGEKEAITMATWAPSVDITENKKAFFITAEIPGIEKQDVHVTYDNGVLTMQGERKYEKEEEGEKYHRVERAYGNFMRRFTLPENVLADKIEATFKNGVLKLTLPKSHNGKAKSTEVKIS